ncbi:MAG: YccF domain-containing protein [Ruminococcus sp.]
MKTFGNILWILFGGALLSLLWFLAAIICFITIVGIPAGIQCVKFASFVLYPFGRSVEYSSKISRFIINVIWIALIGWELAIVSLAVGLIWCITIVGIPFGIQSFKFAQLAIMPFGAKVVQ